MFSANFHQSDTRPLAQFRGASIYLVTILVALHVLSALVELFFGGRWLPKLVFLPLFPWEEPWRWLSYAYAERVGIWFLMSMFFMYFIGRRMEVSFGRRFFGLMYLSLISTGSLLAFLMYYARMGDIGVLSGSTIITFSLFFGTCLMEPDAPFFGVEWITAKWVGLVSLGVGLLGHLASGETVEGMILLTSVLVVYLFLRRVGMPDHLFAVKEALRSTLTPQARPQNPKSTTRPGRPAAAKKESAPSKYYEPKIKPKTDLAPERKAVEEVDAILDKIARSGMDSLTAAEKAALQKASSRLKDTDY